MFDTLNTKVGEIAGEVGMTPSAWNSGIFNMVRNLSETVIVPIAGIVLTFVMVAKYFAELFIAMFLTGIEIQTPADFISKSTIIILQNFCLPTYLFFALQIIYQRLSHNLIAIRQ